MSVTSSCFEVSQSSIWGRFITATKDIMMGELILDEAPLLIGPLWIKTLNDKEAEDDVLNSVVTCVGCFKVIFETQPLSCSYCNWPICNFECERESFHRKYECAIFKHHHITPNTEFALGRLSLIRACLMYLDNQSEWQEFTWLSSKLDKETDKFKAVVKRETINTTRWINEVCKLKVDATTVDRILRTIVLNGFTMCHANVDMYTAEVLYITGSLFVHSCVANSDWIIIPTDQNDVKRWNLRVYARRNIKRNDPITIPYTQDSLTLDTAARKQYLANHFYFDCKCERCVHPTELYFYTSALKCPSCGDSTMLPDNQNDELSPWTCRICRERKDSLTMRGYIEVYENYLSWTMKNKLTNSEKQLRLEMLLSWSEQGKLTETHKVITRTLYYWLKAQNYNDLLENTMESQQKFIKILERATKCLKMFRMFGSLQQIVFLEWLFASAIATYYFKTETCSTIEYDDYSPEEIRKIIFSIYSHMKIAMQIMQWNPQSEFYSSFCRTSYIQFTFWENQFLALEEDPAMDIENVDQTVPSKARGIRKAFLQAQRYLGMIWTRGKAYLFGKKGTIDPNVHRSSMEQSVVANSSNVSEWMVSKPDVSLLSHYDFYFTGDL